MAALLSATHFNPIAKVCDSREEVAELLQLMDQAGVQADATTFGILQEIGLKVGDGKETAEALEVSGRHRQAQGAGRRYTPRRARQWPAMPEHDVHLLTGISCVPVAAAGCGPSRCPLSTAGSE